MESNNLQNNTVFLTKAPPTVNLYSIGYTTAIQITHPYGQNCKITHGHAWIQNQNPSNLFEMTWGWGSSDIK